MEIVTLCLTWLFLLYFIGLNFGYLALNFVAIASLWRTMPERGLEWIGQVQTDLEPPISMVVPAYNEEATIVASVQSLLQLQYHTYEVIVINDGSKDETLNVLIDEFSLVQVPEAYRMRLDSKPVRGIYHSRAHRNLRVVDKENGGKADGLNAGINTARYPLFCAIDADSVLQRDSLEQVVRPFLTEPRTVATGGTVRIANGCQVSNGFLVEAGLPKNIFALFQIVEYLRAFLFGRLGWSPFNALLIISGAFGLFSKEVVVSVGGYREGTIGEDAELVVRMHRMLRARGQDYRITYVPDPFCWTEGPEDLKTLKNQRVRWQRGLADTLLLNISLMGSRNGGTAGWISFPFMFIFEWLGPALEVGGYLFMALCFFTGVISFKAFFIFLLLAIGLGMMLSITSLLLEEIFFTVYKKPKHLLMLFMGVILENFGFRQLNAAWRVMGLYQWLVGNEGTWGDMKRTAKWQQSG